jgi:hypothetical protein
MLTPFFNVWRGIDGWIRWTLTLLGAPLVIVGVTYWGYCWGWWGRNTLALQYLFQCRCPAASEAVRYRPFTVLVSACRQPRSPRLSPDGTRMTFLEQRSDASGSPAPVRMLDLTTGQEYPLPPVIDGLHEFMASDWLLWEDYVSERNRRYGLLNLTTRDVTELPAVAAPYYTGERFSAATIAALKRATRVQAFTRGIIAFGPTFPDNPQDALVVYSGGNEWYKQTLEFVQSLGIIVQEPARAYTTGPVAEAKYTQDGRLWATEAGIFTAASPNPIIATGFPPRRENVGFYVIGWARQDRAVLYTGYLLHVIDGGPSATVIPTQFFPVPQPILLLEVPPEYYTPSPDGAP